jgi:hypothetical protein
MTPATSRRPLGLWLLMTVLLLLSVNGLYGGLAFLLDPSGRLLGVTPDLLSRVPLITTFLLPGLFLLIVMGVLPLALIVLLWRRPEWHTLDAITAATHEHWTWDAALLFSIATLGWIAVQVLLIGYYGGPQILVIAIGAILLLLTLLPSVRRYFAADEPAPIRLPTRRP